MKWQVLDDELQSQKHCVQVQIIGFSVIPIRNHSIITIKDNSNLIALYFIQELRHNAKSENFSEPF